MTISAETINNRFDTSFTEDAHFTSAECTDLADFHESAEIGSYWEDPKTDIIYYKIMVNDDAYAVYFDDEGNLCIE